MPSNNPSTLPLTPAEEVALERLYKLDNGHMELQEMVLLLRQYLRRDAGMDSQPPTIQSI